MDQWTAWNVGIRKGIGGGRRIKVQMQSYPFEEFS